MEKNSYQSEKAPILVLMEQIRDLPIIVTKVTMIILGGLTLDWLYWLFICIIIILEISQTGCHCYILPMRNLKPSEIR